MRDQTGFQGEQGRVVGRHDSGSSRFGFPRSVLILFEKFASAPKDKIKVVGPDDVAL